MGRDTGKSENEQYNREMAAIQAETNARNKAHIADFDASLAKLRAGGKLGVDPYEDSGYLQNQNLLTSAAASAQNKGAKEMLNTEARRTGSNTAARRATISALTREGMRARTDYTAGRRAEDYDKGLDWQKMILGSILAPTGVDTQMFQGATSGRNTATKNLTDIGIADKQMFGNILGAAIQGGASFAGAKWGK